MTASGDHEDPIIRECPACRSVVPAAVFCGNCGAGFDVPVDSWSVLVRPRVYCAAHREPVWVPRISSTLFPRLTATMRQPFRVGLAAVVVAIIALAMLRINGPLGAVAVTGWPLLFLIYVWQSDVFRDMPLRIPLTAMVLGVGFGVGWWLIAGKWLAGTYDVSTGSALLLTEVLNVGFLITVSGAVLMLVPALVTRLFGMPVRESLDGFVIGAFGALWYSTSATTTIVAPQFVEGLLEEHSAARMLQDAIGYGVISPIVAVAAGGLVGLALWFRPDGGPGRNPGRARTALLILTAVGAPLYLVVWMVDAAALPRLVDLAVKFALAILALLIMRCAVQIALLHEAPDPPTGDPVLCVHCEKVVPDAAFCAACGSAARASSRTSRRLRRECPPVAEPAAG